MGRSARGAGGKGRHQEQDKIGKEFNRSREQGKHQEKELGAEYKITKELQKAPGRELQEALGESCRKSQEMVRQQPALTKRREVIRQAESGSEQKQAEQWTQLVEMEDEL